MSATERAQKGNRFKTRITKIEPPPIITYAGRKVFSPENANAQEGRIFFEFLSACQNEFEERNALKTSFDVNQNIIKKQLDKLPRTNLSRYFW